MYCVVILFMCTIPNLAAAENLVENILTNAVRPQIVR